MKKFIHYFTFILSILCYSSISFADVNVQGYNQSDGTYVHPHHRSDPDGNSHNNWSSKGNVNPYTGQYGTKTPRYDKGEQNHTQNSEVWK